MDIVLTQDKITNEIKSCHKKKKEEKNRTLKNNF